MELQLELELEWELKWKLEWEMELQPHKPRELQLDPPKIRVLGQNGGSKPWRPFPGMVPEWEVRGHSGRLVAQRPPGASSLMEM